MSWAFRTVFVLSRGGDLRASSSSARLRWPRSRTRVIQLAEDVLRGRLRLAPHEVGVQLCLGDQEVELALLPLGLRRASGTKAFKKTFQEMSKYLKQPWLLK